jgi:hypothetical protein
MASEEEEKWNNLQRQRSMKESNINSQELDRSHFQEKMIL